MVLEDIITDGSGKKIRILSYELPALDENISYNEYYNLIKEEVNKLKISVLKYSKISTSFTSSEINKNFLSKNTKNIDKYLSVNKQYFDSLTELREITKKGFKRNEYYYFLIDEDFVKIKKDIYNKQEDDNNEEDIDDFKDLDNNSLYI
ncbi:MAG: hypothetical protein PHN56_00835 [Candidatus Nanoarchaeia archaeon]|jgi:hypothetical protein|nr:hypothetical protein [Candidatus Nanoarchaeia archaeon]